jgi:outer membrane protein
MFIFVGNKNNNMKKTITILAFTGLFLMGGNLFGQNTLKLGHIDSRLVFSAMPESDSAQKKLERAAKQIQATLEQSQVEFNKKVEDYNKLTNDVNTSALILKTKEEELRSIQERIQTFQQQAEQDIQNQRTELFKPIQDKAIKAVSDVAEENGFTYIFDTAGGALAYFSPESQDILPLVKAKLGLK